MAERAQRRRRRFPGRRRHDVRPSSNTHGALTGLVHCAHSVSLASSMPKAYRLPVAAPDIRLAALPGADTQIACRNRRKANTFALPNSCPVHTTAKSATVVTGRRAQHMFIARSAHILPGGRRFPPERSPIHRRLNDSTIVQAPGSLNTLVFALHRISARGEGGEACDSQGRSSSRCGSVGCRHGTRERPGQPSP